MLSGNEVRGLLDGDELLEGLARGFARLSGGAVVAPDRRELGSGKGCLLIKPAWTSGSPFAVKLVSTFYDNPRAGIPVIQSLMTLFDETTGSPLAVMDGAAVTAARTAATSALSARHMARADAKVLAIVGAGVQGRAHLEMMSRVREFQEVRVASLFPEEARELVASDPRCRYCESSREAVEGADVVSLCTSSPTPVIETAWIAPGTHVASVGYHPPAGELPVELARAARLAVETRRAFEAPPVGCGELAGLDPRSGVELGELVEGIEAGRTSDSSITVFKSMGHAMEDLVAASQVYREALKRKVGTTVRF